MLFYLNTFLYVNDFNKRRLRAADWMRITIAGTLASLVGACASIGRPEGGPRDEVPPEFVRANPAPGSTGIDRQKIDVFFNENIKLEDIANKLVVSPAQTQQPAVSSNGRRLTVELRDSLFPNTTYTLDFSDAIRDLNEGNILDGFAMDFSTGDTIDTLRISGMVFEARNLEPAQGMVVGVYSNLSDTAVRTLPLERVAKTNQYGQFTIRNLKPGTYNIFAIDDRNRDWHWDRSENIAFSTVTISPTVESVEVSDTLKSSLGEDSIVARTAWHYLPDDVLLTWFNENYKPQYLREYERTDRNRATFKFGAKSDTLPDITVINGPLAGSKLIDLSVLETREGLDSLVYWFRDTTLLKQDSILVSARYLKTDSLEQLSWTTDTLKLFLRGATRQAEKNKAREEERERKEQEKKAKEAEKAREKERKKQEKERAKNKGKNPEKEAADTVSASEGVAVGELPDPFGAAGAEAVADSVAADTIPPAPKIPLLDFKAVSSSQQELNLPVIFEAAQPVENIDSAGWRLEIAVDTLWNVVPDAVFSQDTANIRRYNLSAKWKEGERYRFTVDSLAITDIYGVWNKKFSHEFKVKLLEDYGNIIFDITDLAQAGDSASVVVELLSQQDAVVDTATVRNGTAVFKFVTPGTYYARAFIDSNHNGRWDTGNLADSIQPEDVFYYPKKLNLRKNWDIDQEWALFETAVDAQKPEEIKKNKPKTRDRNSRDNRNPDEDDEYYEDDEGFGQNYFDEGSWGNGSQYHNAGRNSSSSSRRNNASGLRQNRTY